jgi:hypothetical protein
MPGQSPLAAAPAVPAPTAIAKQAPAEMAAPPVLPVTKVEKPAYPDQPALPAAGVKPGTTVEQGARAAIRLGGGCDPAVSLDCLSAKP